MGLLKTVGDPDLLRSLIDRLGTAHEMLCHLGDATATVLGSRPRKADRHTDHHLRQFGL